MGGDRPRKPVADQTATFSMSPHRPQILPRAKNKCRNMTDQRVRTCVSFYRQLLSITGGIILFLNALCPSTASCQEITKITGVRLVYWRAFHGRIEQEVGLDFEKKWYMTTIITPEGGPQKPAIIKDIGLQDMLPIKDIVNDLELRSFLQKTALDSRLDGSRLQITVSENSLSYVLSSQDAFMPNASPEQRKLRKLAEILFRLGGVELPPDEIY
jgi:hypothetical protein